MYKIKAMQEHFQEHVSSYTCRIFRSWLVICHMEGSGKWPSDRLAIRHIKAAFHIRLGELLNTQHGYTYRPSPTHLDVLKVICVFMLYFY